MADDFRYCQLLALHNHMSTGFYILAWVLHISGRSLSPALLTYSSSVSNGSLSFQPFQIMSKAPSEIIEDICKLSNNLETAAKGVTEMARNFERTYGVDRTSDEFTEISDELSSMSKKMAEVFEHFSTTAPNMTDTKMTHGDNAAEHPVTGLSLSAVENPKSKKANSVTE